MRRGGPLAGLGLATLPDNNRFVRCDLTEQAKEAAPFSDSLKVYADNFRFVVVSEIVEVVTGIKDCRIPKTDRFTHTQSMTGGGHTKGDGVGAALTDKPD